MNKGFTLVELLVVVLIIGVLSAIALPQYTTAVERSRSAEALSLLAAISDSAQRYYFQHDAWPIDENETPQWGLLDIDVPEIPGEAGHRGGKNFEVTMHGSPDGTQFAVVAERKLTDGKYYLLSLLEDNSDSDTILVTRYCSDTLEGEPFASGNSKAKTYCDAITGGHNMDGKF